MQKAMVKATAVKKPKLTKNPTTTVKVNICPLKILPQCKKLWAKLLLPPHSITMLANTTTVKNITYTQYSLKILPQHCKTEELATENSTTVHKVIGKDIAVKISYSTVYCTVK
jgi:hypothetical protein